MFNVPSSLVSRCVRFYFHELRVPLIGRLTSFVANIYHPFEFHKFSHHVFTNKISRAIIFHHLSSPSNSNSRNPSCDSIISSSIMIRINDIKIRDGGKRLEEEVNETISCPIELNSIRCSNFCSSRNRRFFDIFDF